MKQPDISRIFQRACLSDRLCHRGACLRHEFLMRLGDLSCETFGFLVFALVHLLLGHCSSVSSALARFLWHWIDDSTKKLTKTDPKSRTLPPKHSCRMIA